MGPSHCGVRRTACRINRATAGTPSRTRVYVANVQKFCRKWFVLCMILFAFKTDEPLRTYLYSTNHGGPPASWLIASFTVPTTVACSRLG
jgi:hypothetical protein